MTDTNEPSRRPLFQCDEVQLAMLRRCSDHGNMAEWNQWRTKKPLAEVCLYEADLKGACLDDANLANASMLRAHLQGAQLARTDLTSARLISARLQGATFFQAHLESACFSVAAVNGETLFRSCTVNKNTDFNTVALGACRMSPGLKETLEYNIRRKRWEQWYTDGPKWHRRAKQLVRPFWWASDYGRSTGRIALVFFILSLAFAGVYYACDLLFDNGLVHNLSEVDGTPVAAWLVPVRAAYFSIVTMTTLGFGDMHANPHSLAGHLLLAFQVILGYVLLGALVCRLAILFQAGGPAAKFSKPPKATRKSKNPRETDQ